MNNNKQGMVELNKIKIVKMCHEISWTKEYHELLLGGEKRNKQTMEKLILFFFYVILEKTIRKRKQQLLVNQTLKTMHFFLIF